MRNSPASVLDRLWAYCHQLKADAYWEVLDAAKDEREPIFIPLRVSQKDVTLLPPERSKEGVPHTH